VREVLLYLRWRWRCRRRAQAQWAWREAESEAEWVEGMGVSPKGVSVGGNRTLYSSASVSKVVS
jgi:hypothetical protein